MGARSMQQSASTLPSCGLGCLPCSGSCSFWSSSCASWLRQTKVRLHHRHGCGCCGCCWYLSCLTYGKRYLHPDCELHSCGHHCIDMGLGVSLASACQHDVERLCCAGSGGSQQDATRLPAGLDAALSGLDADFLALVCQTIGQRDLLSNRRPSCMHLPIGSF